MSGCDYISRTTAGCGSLSICSSKLYRGFLKVYTLIERQSGKDKAERLRNLQDKEELLKKIDPDADWFWVSPGDYLYDGLAEIEMLSERIRNDLSLVIGRRVFPGRCPVCEDW